MTDARYIPFSIAASRWERWNQIKSAEEANKNEEIHSRYETEDDYVDHLLNHAKKTIEYFLRYGGTILEDGIPGFSDQHYNRLEEAYMCLCNVSRMIHKWRPYGHPERRPWHPWQADKGDGTIGWGLLGYDDEGTP